MILGPYTFVLSAFGRIQIHRQIWNFIEQYKKASTLYLTGQEKQIRLNRFYVALFYGYSVKKEEEKSKKEEENGDRKINTLIIGNSLFSAPSSFLAYLIVSFLTDFPLFSSVIWSKLRHNDARRRVTV